MVAGGRHESDLSHLPVVAIVGPTGIGKTALAVLLAREIRMEVISADSRQVYRGMDIGTGKPTPEEQGAVRHHLIGVVDPSETYHAARFRRDALGTIEEIRARGRLPVVVGGTGLYLRALVRGLSPAPPGDAAFRRAMTERARVEGVAALHADLQRVDPAAAACVGTRDLIRITRALEVFHLTGRPLSGLHRWDTDLPLRFLMVGLTMDRPLLYQRLDLRCQEMIQKGLAEEVRRLLAEGIDPDCPAMQGLGYRHMLAYLRGRSTLAEALRTMQRDTRRYAKRQWAWFRGERASWVEAGGAPEEVAGIVKMLMESHGLLGGPRREREKMI